MRSYSREQRAVKYGFTLVELLMVVAIIAVLALIALPNFLAAQTRAKVSRAKADLRSVVTALEAYHVDNARYPTYHYSSVPTAALEFHIGGEVPDFAQPDPNWNGAIPITTPIAYLSTMPGDPFCTHLLGAPVEITQFLYVNWDYAVDRVTAEPRRTTFMRMLESYGPYRLHSRGPDLNGPNTGVPYDPTNGSVSPGDITYGPNVGFERFVPAPVGARAE